MTRTQPPPGFTLPRTLSSTLVDRNAPDLELEVINKLLPLLADKSHTVFDLCDVSGLNFDELATLLESERVDKAYRAMVRILAIRQKFIDAQSHFVTTAQLLSIASAQPMDAKEADQSRKAANKLEALTRSSPVAERGGGGGGRRSLTEGEVLTSPSPSPAAEMSPSPPTEGVRPSAQNTSGFPSQPSSVNATDTIAVLQTLTHLPPDLSAPTHPRPRTSTSPETPCEPFSSF
jgi:hypothetical protein